MITWQVCCPILDYSDESGVFQEPVLLDDNLRIDVTPAWYRSGAATPRAAAFGEDLRESGLAIVGEYDAESSDALQDAVDLK